MKRPNWSTITSCTLLGVVVLSPLVALVVRGLSQAPADSGAAFTGARQFLLLGRSVFLAVAVGGMGSMLGLVAGYAVASQRQKWQRPLLLLMLLPLLIPPFIHALSWIMCADAVGRSVHGMIPVITILSLAYFPLAGLLTWVGLSKTQGLVESAVLARSRWNTFWAIELPLIRPYLFTAFLLIGLFSFSDYGVPSLLRVNTYPVAVFAQFAAYYDVRGAVMASWPYVVIPLVALGAWEIRIGQRVTETVGQRHFRTAGAFSRAQRQIFGVCFVGIVGVVGVFPIAAQIMRAGAPATYIEAWHTAFPQIMASIALAAAAATLLLVVAAAALPGFRSSRGASRGLLNYLSLLPIAIPGTIFGIGMIFLWNRPETEWIYGSVAVICLLYCARFIPFALRSLVAGVHSVGEELFDAARLTDAGAFSRFSRILLPLLAPSAVVGWALCFILSLRELAGTLLVAPPGVETVGVRIYSLYHYGATKLVAALSVFMITGTVLVFGLAVWGYRTVRKIGRQ